LYSEGTPVMGSYATITGCSVTVGSSAILVAVSC
jgi:hypothetical protein